MKNIGLLLVIAGLLTLATTTFAGDSTSYTLSPEVLASGSQAASSANYSFSSTFGESLIGSSTSADYSMCSGFWCQIVIQYNVYLPLTLKGS